MGRPAWLEWKSRMRREPHVRFCEGGGVKFPPATRPQCWADKWGTHAKVVVQRRTRWLNGQRLSSEPSLS